MAGSTTGGGDGAGLAAVAGADDAHAAPDAPAAATTGAHQSKAGSLGITLLSMNQMGPGRYPDALV